MRARKYARTKILQSKQFIETARLISGLLHKRCWALIGGLAVAHHANPPVTVDVDILVDDNAICADALTEALLRRGWRKHPLYFPSRLKGLPKNGIAFEKGRRPIVMIDVLFTGKDKFLTGAVKNSDSMKVDGFSIPVIGAEDLIIMKSLANRDKDHDDIAEIYRAIGDRLDDSYISRTLEDLM